MTVRPAKTQISLGVCPVWSVFAGAQWVAKDPGWSESSLGALAILLVLSWGSSFYDLAYQLKIFELLAHQYYKTITSLVTKTWMLFHRNASCLLNFTLYVYKILVCKPQTTGFKCANLTTQGFSVGALLVKICVYQPHSSRFEGMSFCPQDLSVQASYLRI